MRLYQGKVFALLTSRTNCLSNLHRDGSSLKRSFRISSILGSLSSSMASAIELAVEIWPKPASIYVTNMRFFYFFIDTALHLKVPNGAAKLQKKSHIRKYVGLFYRF